MDFAWSSTAEEVLQHFRVEKDRGLTAAQASKHLEIYGKNGKGLVLLSFYAFVSFSDVTLA